MAEDPQRTKKILLGVLLVAALGYFGFEYGYAPRAAEIAQLERRLESLQMQNRTARILTEEDGQDDVERRLASYRDQLVQVEGLIPSSEELPDLLDAISMEGQRTGVELTLIQPTGAQVEEFYTRRTYQLAALGSYHQIGEFLTQIASLPRIVTPTNLILRVQQETGVNGNPRLEARFAIETYVLPSNLAEANGHEAE